MKDKNSAEYELHAGDFSEWLSASREMLMNKAPAVVPCGDCRACCTSSYFIHIMPEEKETMKKIDRRLLFNAPGLPEGNVLMGYDKRGYCPMFIDNSCSIYPFRPLTCRNYDCRIFTAAGIEPDIDQKGLISKQVRRWRFSYVSDNGREKHEAVMKAARFIRDNHALFPAGAVPVRAAELAILAIKVYNVFYNTCLESKTGRVKASDADTAKAIVARFKEFETASDNLKKDKYS